MASSSVSRTTCVTPSARASRTASSKSPVGVVGDTVVSATQRGPSTAAASCSRKLESTPPENATSTESNVPSSSRRRVTLAATSGVTSTLRPADEEVGRQVALARVAEDGQDDGALAERLRDLDRRGRVCAGRDADELT